MFIHPTDIFFFTFFSVISNAQAILVQCQKLKVEFHAKPNSQIHNPIKNAYHQSKNTPGKTSLDEVYSLDLICNESLMSPGRALLEYNKKGAVIKMSIEIQFNVPVGYLNNTDQLPTGSVVRLEFIPSNHYVGSLCEGKPTVLLWVVIEANFTLQNRTFHDFQQRPIDHTKCFYSGSKKLTRNLLDIRPNHATFNSCKIAVCYCKNTTSTGPGRVGGHPTNWGNPGHSAEIGNLGPLPPPGAIGGPSPQGGNQAPPAQGANPGPVPQQGAVGGPYPQGGNQALPTQGANQGPVPQQGQLVTISTKKRNILDVSTQKSQNKKIIDGKLTYIDDGKSIKI